MDLTNPGLTHSYGLLSLTKNELKAVKEWTYKSVDKSISTEILRSFWSSTLEYIPTWVAPNVLTLMGFFCLLESLRATYMCSIDSSSSSFLLSLYNIFLIFTYQTLDALDGMQARRTRNGSPVGELFDHACDNVGSLAIILVVLKSLNMVDPFNKWIIMHITLLIFLSEHLSALRSKGQEVVFNRYTGPGEILFATYGLLFISPILQVSANVSAYVYAILNSHILGCMLYIPYIYALFLVTKHCLDWQAKNILMAMGTRIAFSYFTPTNDLSLLCEGLFWAVLTSEVILSKMANKIDVNVSILFLSIAMIFNRALVLPFIAYYYVHTFNQLLNECKIPMFRLVRTCFVNGVFDLGHYNHMKLFNSALVQTGADRLIVGVMSDADVKKYKGESRPIEPADERVKFVAEFPNVYKVIKDADWSDVPRSFIEEHNIDVVAHSAEYSPKASDYAYSTPYQMGIVTLIPRGEGASTSERIDKILALGK